LAELAIVGASTLADEPPPVPELARRRAAVLGAVGTLRRSLASYLTAAAELGQPAALPPGCDPEQLPARWAQTLAMRLDGLIAAREAASLASEAHSAMMATLRGQEEKRRTGGRPAVSGLLPASTLHLIWSALPAARRLSFVLSLSEEAADRLLGYQVSLPRPALAESAPSARCAD
jgi:hypothetical protein